VSHSTGRSLRGAPPAAAATLAEIEAALGAPLPDELVSLYRATNGVFNTFGQWWVVWPLEQMVEAKQWMINYAGYLEQWVPFGDDGAGNPFCFHRADKAITCLGMIEGTHEPVAHGLAEFWIMD
jgi:hypothetical protein